MINITNLLNVANKKKSYDELLLIETNIEYTEIRTQWKTFCDSKDEKLNHRGKYFESLLDNSWLHFGQFESSGEFNLGTIIDALSYHISTSSENTIFIIDEPESSLHPQLQKYFVEFFTLIKVNELIKEKNIKFIIATHSPFIISSSANKPDQKVYLIDNKRNIDIYGKSDIKARFGYSGGEILIAVNKMLGSGLSDILPTKLFFCEASLAEFISALCNKQNSKIKPIFIAGRGDSNSMDKGQIFKDIITLLSEYTKLDYLKIEYKIIIDDYPQVKYQIAQLEIKYPDTLLKLKSDEQEKLFWNIKKDKFVEFLTQNYLPQWDFINNNQTTFSKFLNLNKPEKYNKNEKHISEEEKVNRE